MSAWDPRGNGGFGVTRPSHSGSSSLASWENSHKGAHNYFREEVVLVGECCNCGEQAAEPCQVVGDRGMSPVPEASRAEGAGKDSGRRVSRNGQGKGAAFPPCHPIFYGAHGGVKCREGWLAMGSPVCIAAPPPRPESEDNRLLPAICTSCSPRGAMQPLPQRRWGAPMPAGHPPVGGW